MARKVSKAKLKESLVSQLEDKNIKTDYNLSEVEEYLKYWEANRELFKDVKERGVKITTYNSKGLEIIKTNESLNDAQKNTASMLKILQVLGLQDPVMKGSADDYL